MTQRPINDPALSQQGNEDWQCFLALLQQSFAENLHQDLLQLLLTPDERAALGTRVRIIQELMRGELSQRELKSQLGAGIEDNMTFAWMVIENMHQRGESRSASLMLPEIILQGINQGSELGDEMEKLTGITEVKRKGGAIGVFTAGKLTRTSVYHQALVLALAPFHNSVYQVRTQTH